MAAVVSPIAADRDVNALTAKHRAAIDDLKAKTQAFMPEDRKDGDPWDGEWLVYDDLFFLRYIMSYKTAAKSVEPVRKCLEYRAAHKELIRAATTGRGFDDWPEKRILDQYHCGSYVTGAAADGGVLFIARGNHGQRQFIWDLLPRAMHVKIMMASKERGFHANDATTRATGKIAKVITLFDMETIPLSSLMDRRQSSIYDEITAAAGYLYPQMADKTCIVNAPSWMASVVGIFRKLLPKRTMEKIQVFSSVPAMWQSKWAKSAMVPDRMPDFMGGELTEYNDLLKCKHILTAEDEGGPAFEEVSVGARSIMNVRHTVVQPGNTTAIISIQSHGLEMMVTFQADDGSVTTLAEVTKINFEDGPLRCRWTCASAGEIEIRFDNRANRLKGKTVLCRIKSDSADELMANLAV